MKPNNRHILVIIFFSLVTLIGSESYATPIYPALELQGHRGARGLAPENSLPAFHQAYIHGMTTIELDSTLTADGQLVIYHDTEINIDLCRTSTGSIPQKSLMTSITLNEIQKLNCGAVKHKRFPQQTLVPVNPPVLTEGLSLEKIWNYKP